MESGFPALRMADMHMHIVPGVDDGSSSLTMSEHMLALAYLQGVRAVAATPHSFAFACQPELVHRQFQALQARLAASPLDMRLFLGCEVRCEPWEMERTLARLEQGVFPSLNGTRYVLAEFSARVSPDQALEMAAKLRAGGWIPVLAHTERYPALFDGALQELSRLGCLFQVNAYSLAEEPDSQTARRARSLLESRLASFLGSDAHRLDFRPPNVRSGLEYLFQTCPPEYAQAAAWGNAERLLF